MSVWSPNESFRAFIEPYIFTLLHIQNLHLDYLKNHDFHFIFSWVITLNRRGSNKMCSANIGVLTTAAPNLSDVESKDLQA